MFLFKAVARSDHGKPYLLRPGSAILTVLVIAIAASACTGGQEASRSPDTASRVAASPTARTVASSDTQHVVLAVRGMYCASCEQTVVTMLRRTAGVLRADVSVEQGEAAVSYDSTRTSPAQLVQIVKTLGYDASVKRT